MKYFCLALFAMLFLFSCDCTEPDFEENFLQGTYHLADFINDPCQSDDVRDWENILDIISQNDESNRLSQSVLNVDSDGSFTLSFLDNKEGRNVGTTTGFEYQGYIADGEINEHGQIYGCIKHPETDECNAIIISIINDAIIWDWMLNRSCNLIWTWENK